MTDISKYWDESYAAGKDYRFLSNKTITKVLEYLGQDTERTCLDIGCGTGQLTRELVHRGFRCTGIDVSPIAISIASSLTVIDRAQYVCADIEQSTPQFSQQFGLITCKYVYAFIKDKPRFLRKIKRLLSYDGVFFIVTPLLSDVPIEKQSIAVDLEQTIVELQSVFVSVDSFAESGAMCFICTQIDTPNH